MAGFLDPFGVGDGVSAGPGGLSRSKRHRSRSRVGKKKRSRSRSSSRDRHRDRDRDRDRGLGAGLGAGLSSFFNDNSHYHKHSSSRASFFGLNDDRNRSRSSFFGFSKPSYYKRSSRHGFLHRSYKQLKRLLRDLAHWAKRHPWKVFFLVIMPLVSGGVLTALLARFGLRMPHSIERLLGLASKAVTGDAGALFGEAVRMAGDFGDSRSRHGGGGGTHVRVRDGDHMYWERDYRRGDDAWGDTISGMAKMFI